MKRFIVLTAIVSLFSLTASAQTADSDVRYYHTGLGLRLGGYTSGFTVKGFINSKGALEGIVGFGRRSLVLTGLYEHHFPITGAKGLNLYAGGGAHVGFFGHRSSYLIKRNKKENVVYVIDEGATAVVPGIDFVFGIEYKFNGAPFTIGADLKPFADFYDGVSGYADGALNVRYVF